MRRSASVFGFLLLTAFIAHAQDASPWVGQKVVTKYQTPLRVGNQVADEDFVFRIYTVERAQRGWLWLAAGSVAGWVRSSEVVPFDHAIDFYTQEIRANPGEAAAYGHRGIIWAKTGETDIAIADFTEAICLDPEDAIGYVNRGNAWYLKKEYAKSIADCNDAIRLDPKYANAYNIRGSAWYGQQDYDRAIASYNEAIRLDPKVSLSYRNRGNAWRGRKDYDTAIIDCNEAIRLDPKDADAFNVRGHVWRGKKRYDKAIADYDEAIRLEPKNALAHYNRAIAVFSARRDGAVDGMKSALAVGGWGGELSPYAVILGHFAALRVGQAGQAKSFLDDAATGCNTSAWPYPVVKFLRGEIDDAKLLAGATDNDNMTEVRCYVGLDALEKNRSAAALAQFRWVKENGNPLFAEYAIALAELDWAEAKPSGPGGP